ncbi:MAG: YraN family protein [Bacteroidetes bacterium]|jgi:putative endonuclease|nr:MAG: YraN family protein [Bacteroidota bacterium]
MAAHNDLGKKGEEIAAGFLEAKGYQILDRNYRYEKAELDLVALRLDPAELVIAEVKTRSTRAGDYPEEAVSDAKQRLIFKATDAYLYEKRLFTVPIRFDIISIQLFNPEHPLIYHIEDAFRKWGK